MDENKFFDLCLWCLAGLGILVILTSCSAVVDIPATATAAPSVTATVQTSILVDNSPTPRPSCTVTAYTLNMRTAGTTRSSVKQILERGETLTVLHGGAWLKVQTAQRVTGWVYGRYCR